MFLPAYLVFGVRWEEWLITAAQFYFCIALIPTLKHKLHKPPLYTCVPTALGCWVVALGTLNLGLFLTTFGVVLTAATWTAVSIQRYKLDALSRPSIPVRKLIDQLCD